MKQMEIPAQVAWFYKSAWSQMQMLVEYVAVIVYVSGLSFANMSFASHTNYWYSKFVLIFLCMVCLRT